MDNAASPPVRKKILVVDDNPDIRRLIRLSLEDPYEILEAEDGESAMAMVRQQLPSLVILDIMMPGALDGLQVLQAIKQAPELQHILVVMLTARGQSSDFQFGMQKGADAYFVKPFSPLVLLQWISSRI
jgi:CheY-like chemotaxis protein